MKVNKSTLRIGMVFMLVHEFRAAKLEPSVPEHKLKFDMIDTAHDIIITSTNKKYDVYNNKYKAELVTFRINSYPDTFVAWWSDFKEGCVLKINHKEKY